MWGGRGMIIKAYLHLGYVGCDKADEIEIPDDELDGLSEEERSKVIDSHFTEWVFENTDCYWEEVEEV